MKVKEKESDYFYEVAECLESDSLKNFLKRNLKKYREGKIKKDEFEKFLGKFLSENKLSDRDEMIARHLLTTI